MALFSLAKATEEIILVDSYADILALDYFKEKRNDVSVRFVISSKSRLTQVEVDAFNLSFGNRTVRVGDGFHDLFSLLTESFFIISELR